MLTYLDFEKPIAELERRLTELRETASAGSIDIDSEVAKLEAKSAKLLKDTYARLLRRGRCWGSSCRRS